MHHREIIKLQISQIADVDSSAIGTVNCARDIVRRVMTTSPASTPGTEKTFFAKSIPTVETMLMRHLLLKRVFSQRNPGTAVPPHQDGEVPCNR
jgi:hypothetical protein